MLEYSWFSPYESNTTLLFSLDTSDAFIMFEV